jgi:hypothetical protein
MDLKTRNKLAKLVAMLGSSNSAERENANRRIDEILRKHKRSWSELPEILRSTAPDPQPQPPPDVYPGDENTIGPLDLIMYILKQYVEMPEYEYLAVALWVMHTHVFEQFMVSPRLAVVSPVRGCGKTIVLSILNVLCAQPEKTDGITPAAIFRLIDSKRPTLLCDEADNYDLPSNRIFRYVLNSGHRRGGSVMRVIDGTPRRYSTFAPVALAVIGTLPLPLVQRSVVIRMTRADGSRQLRRFDEGDLIDLETIYAAVYRWALHIKLNTDPPMPTGVRNRAADNWRPLVGIADACSEDWGAAARKAAVAMSSGYHDEDAAVMLLGDIRQIFDERGVDRIASAVLVAALLSSDDAIWGEWRGIRDDRQPRKLSQGELARLLAPFGIRPRSIWPPRRTSGSQSAKGYLRSDFKRAWRAYCGSAAGTPAHPSSIRRLRAI